VQHYTIKLTNARVTQVNLKLLNNKSPDNMKYLELEDVSFSYDTITCTWTDGGIATSDSAVGAR
jgi:type VI secretion system secreted protein Hcp